ncbi:MAG: tRNA (adenosine(37)-N6)-threonylcarbamoyltransferase complex transferase subunit TsaD [Candidatus Margulisiibacteriota bacterium]|jgi:N6-L-threonylcarbamoyladenine synthase
MKILAIETSCDETAAAVVEDGRKVLSNVVASQIEIHKKYGGVVPEVASRHHLEAILPVIEEALSKALGSTFNEEQSSPSLRGVPHRDDEAISRKDLPSRDCFAPLAMTEGIDAIAVTEGPGLMGALLVGLMAAKTLAMVTGKPLIGVNHLEGHIYANFLLDVDEKEKAVPEFPFICLVVSGGHTEILLVPKAGEYKLLGRTRDDAAGECFDKAARYLGLGYPGGPLVDKLARQGNPALVKLPTALLTPLNGQTKETNFDFSFSGLKTEITLYKEVSETKAGGPKTFMRTGKNASGKNFTLPDLVACFQETVVDVLVRNTLAAAKLHKIDQIVLAGGVSANSRLRTKMQESCQDAHKTLFFPKLKFCTDNAAMIAAAAYPKYLRQEFADLGLISKSRYPIPATHRDRPEAVS